MAVVGAAEVGLIDHARQLSTQARDPAPHYQHLEIGYNYRLSKATSCDRRKSRRAAKWCRHWPRAALRAQPCVPTSHERFRVNSPYEFHIFVWRRERFGPGATLY
jgi:hypothetical protein